MTRRQFGISALVSQTSFRARGETSGDVTKCWLSSQGRNGIVLQFPLQEPFLTLYQESTLAWRSTVLNKFTSFDRSSMRNSYFRRQGVLGLNLNQRPSIALSNLNPQISELVAKWRIHSTLLDVTQDIQWTYQQLRISRETISLKNINVANEKDSNRFRNFISTVA